MMSNMEPMSISYQELRDITGDFSHFLGEGAYGRVYKGTRDGKQIAVKVLEERPARGRQEVQYKEELKNLLTVRHKNIIELDSFCYETDQQYNNVTKLSDSIVRTALCFEFAQNGHVRNYISDQCDKLPWEICYQIIKGTCEGLQHLHHHQSGTMWHLDLKPENILLNEDMVPKIADFGLSRLIEGKTSKSTESAIGTWKYTPMEFKKKGTISKEFDIYSLGVIIFEIVAGSKMYDETDEDLCEKHIAIVLEKWKHKLSPAYCLHVKTCLEISLKCLSRNRQKRPKIEEILDELNSMENIKD